MFLWPWLSRNAFVFKPGYPIMFFHHILKRFWQLKYEYFKKVTFKISEWHWDKSFRHNFKIIHRSRFGVQIHVRIFYDHLYKPLQWRDDFHSSKKIELSCFFSIARPFDRFKDFFYFFLYLGKYGLCTIARIKTQ